MNARTHSTAARHEFRLADFLLGRSVMAEGKITAHMRAGIVCTLFLFAVSQPAIAQPLGWTYPEALNTTAPGDGSSSDVTPQLTTDGAGNWVAVWYSDNSLGDTIDTDWDILFARSLDNGAHWTDPAPLNTNAPGDTGLDYGATVTTDGAGTWVTVWYSDDSLGGTNVNLDDDILVACSFDDGLNWTAPAPLNTNAPTDSGADHSPEVATDRAGNWIAVWDSIDDLEGTIGTDPDILFAHSTNPCVDEWTYPMWLNNNAPTDAPTAGTGWDGGAALTTDGAGMWIAAWRLYDDAIDNDYDLLFARSTDNGQTWTDPAYLNTNAATDSGSDHNPEITTDGAGNWVATWYSDETLGGTIGSDYDVLFARSTDNGQTWTDPEPLNTNAASDSGRDWPPQLTTDGAGNWIAVWCSDDNFGGTIGADWDCLFARSIDNGQTWTDPEPLNINAFGGGGDDREPELATDGSGNWIAVWGSSDNLEGTIGSDSDILFARALAEPIPAVSNWGMVAMTLLVLAAGTLVLKGRRQPRRAVA